MLPRMRIVGVLAVAMCVLAAATGALALSAEPMCEATEFVGMGKACGEVNGVKQTCKAGYLTCTTHGAGTQPTCAVPRAGDPCVVDTDCGQYAYSRCIAGKCDWRRSAGEACVDGAQCGSGSCTDGVCTGKAEGAACNSALDTNPCATGLYCGVGDTCIRSAAPGEACAAIATLEKAHINQNLWDACAVGSYCNLEYQPNVHPLPDAGTCVRWNSLPEGDTCGANWDSPYLCRHGFECDPERKVCRKPAGCRASRECSLGAYCACDEDAPTDEGVCTFPRNVDCADEDAELVQCLAAHGCPNSAVSVLASNVAGSCLFENCHDEYENMQCCARRGHSKDFVVYHGINCSRRAGLTLLELIAIIGACLIALALFYHWATSDKNKDGGL